MVCGSGQVTWRLPSRCIFNVKILRTALQVDFGAFTSGWFMIRGEVRTGHLSRSTAGVLHHYMLQPDHTAFRRIQGTALDRPVYAVVLDFQACMQLHETWKRKNEPSYVVMNLRQHRATAEQFCSLASLQFPGSRDKKIML